MDVQLGGLPVETDVSQGVWLSSARRRGEPGTVGSLVPAAFESYARVLHPAVRYVGDDDVEVSWAEVAAHNGTVAHRLMQWPAVTGAWEYMTSDNQSPVWDGAPSDGHLPAPVADRLTAVLARHTAVPDDCLFGHWVGHGFDADAVRSLPQLLLRGGHDVVLLRGVVAHAARNLAPEPHEQSPTLWWPADRAWCVVTDIDLMSTYVGGTAACVAELLDEPGLEIFPAAPDDPVAWADDSINATPPRS